MYPGTDIIEIERMAAALQRRPELAERLFTPREREDLRSKGPRSYAARFAGKEAVLKALGTGLRGLSWHDVEIISSPGGEPAVNLSPRAKALAEARGGSGVRVSLAHSQTQAIAFAVLVCDQKNGGGKNARS